MELFEPESMLGQRGVAEVVAPAAGGEHEIVVRDLASVGDQQAPVEIGAGDLRLPEIRIVEGADQLPYWSSDLARVEQVVGRPAGIYVYSTRIYDLITWEPPLFAEAMALSTFVLGILLLMALVYQRAAEGRQYATITGRGSLASDNARSAVVVPAKAGTQVAARGGN